MGIQPSLKANYFRFIYINYHFLLLGRVGRVGRVKLKFEK